MPPNPAELFGVRQPTDVYKIHRQIGNKCNFWQTQLRNSARQVYLQVITNFREI